MRILREEEEGDYFFVYHNCRNYKWRDKIPVSFHVQEEGSHFLAGDVGGEVGPGGAHKGPVGLPQEESALLASGSAQVEVLVAVAVDVAHRQAGAKLGVLQCLRETVEPG